jgi:translation initiation factor 2 beta subunit (eIF-2beta)/eIF-5
VQFAPEKLPSTTRSNAAEQADALFWKTLHDGQYDQIPVVLNALTEAYLENPNDAITAAHIGWMHVWRLSERARMAEIPATITDHAMLSRRYFEEAVRLNSTEARYLGFYASMLLAEGAIHKDEKLTRKGYFTLLDSIKAFPEFNYFTAGYVMSDRPHDSERFQEGLEYQWLNLDVCVGEKVDRQNPDYQKYMHLEIKEGPKRVCWNSWIAPHNFEGFFLNMGDMLVKSGDWQTGQKIYANARLSADYAQWKFRDVLEERIAQAEANVAMFNAPPDATRRMAKPIMVQSAFSCVGCHQK